VTRRATKINEFKAAHEYFLVLDAGNSLIGDRPFSQQSQGATSVEAMNMMHYDAMSLARKDLELGAETLRERMSEAQFPFLSANVTVEGRGELLAQDYVIRSIGGHRVALIGVTESGTVPGFTVADPVETLGRLLPDVTRQADIVILLTHATPSLARQIASSVPGIDLIVTGGDEHLPLGEETASGTLIVHADVSTPGHAGRNMGLVTMDFDSQGKLAGQTNTIIVLSQTLEEDPEMLEWLQGTVVTSRPTPTSMFQ